MRKASAFCAAFFFFGGLALFLSLGGLYHRVAVYYSSHERGYGSSVYSASVLVLRQDAYGKGYFGAHRNGGRIHQGIDILAPVGRPICAAKSGRILVAGWDRGYGNYVEILHSDGLRSRYAHLSRIYIRAGEWVRKSDIVGACGKTGNAADPRIKAHLHFEVRAASTPVNPAPLMDAGIQVHLS